MDATAAAAAAVKGDMVFTACSAAGRPDGPCVPLPALSGAAAASAAAPVSQRAEKSSRPVAALPEKRSRLEGLVEKKPLQKQAPAVADGVAGKKRKGEGEQKQRGKAKHKKR